MLFKSRRLRMRCAALALLATGAAEGFAQSLPAGPSEAPGRPQATASMPAQQFPAIPLRRDEADSGSGARSAIFATLFLVAIAGAGLILVKRRMPGALAGNAGRWLGTAQTPAEPRMMGRTALTNQASVHAVEWGGEELLLGCSPQGVTVLARRPSQPRDARSEVEP